VHLYSAPELRKKRLNNNKAVLLNVVYILL